MERKSIVIPFWNDTQRLIVIYGIACSMLYLHSLDILHRDLSPGNVLLNKFLFPKLCDFGLSKKISHQNNEQISIEKVHGTNKSVLFGTPGFIAPEVCTNLDYSKAGDVYSFGMIVYEILSKTDPYESWNVYQIIHEVACSKKRPKHVKSIDNNYWSLIERCWSGNPKSRPTFEEIVKELREKPNYITQNVNGDVFHSYVEFIQNQTPTPPKIFKNYKVSSIKV